MPNVRTLVGDGFTLEPQLEAHAAELFKVLNDPVLYEFDNQPPASETWLRLRFKHLESRRSPDGHQRWLNWVVRLASGEAVGYVQATAWPEGRALVAYVLGSVYWGCGLATRAVDRMRLELVEAYGVLELRAEFFERNRRSLRLLERLGFQRASAAVLAEHPLSLGEILMSRPAAET